jgi:hypothetical protein
MARSQETDPVKLFVAVLWARSDALKNAVNALGSCWGEIDFAGADHPFDATDYYEPEMGRNLSRRLISFLQLVPPDILPQAKHICNQIEDQLSGEHGRLVNLDVGYLDHNKIVLASFKGAGQKIYLKDGVWADMVARYRKGKYHPFEWTFPDFRDERYGQELLRIRWAYLCQIRNNSPRPPRE